MYRRMGQERVDEACVHCGFTDMSPTCGLLAKNVAVLPF